MSEKIIEELKLKIGICLDKYLEELETTKTCHVKKSKKTKMSMPDHCDKFDIEEILGYK